MENQGQILPFASILKNYKSYKSTQWEQRVRSDPSPNTHSRSDPIPICSQTGLQP